jgi:hypothetical protein
MNAREACDESLYQSAVRRTEDGRLMIFGKTFGRAFIEACSEEGRPVFHEVKRKYIEHFLNCSDWKPWTDHAQSKDT